MVDHAPADGAGLLSVFESGAMLLYLADKTGKFLPKEPRGRSAAIEWVMWQMAGQGPMLGQAGHFRNYAPEKILYGIERLLRTMASPALPGARLPRLAGHEYRRRRLSSIADMACWSWIRRTASIMASSWSNFPNIVRPLVSPRSRRGLAVICACCPISRCWAPPTFTDEERKLLFGQKG